MAYLFDASTEVIRAPAHALINDARPITIHFWAKVVAFDTTFRRAVNKMDDNQAAGQGLFAVNFFDDGGVDTLRLNATAWATTRGEWSLNNPMSTGVYHSVGVTYAYSVVGDDPTFYVDGSGSAPSTENNTPAGSLVTGESKEMQIGNRGTTVNRNHNGDIAEVAIWNRVLSSEEMSILAAKYSALFILDGLVYYNPMIREVRSHLDGAVHTVTGTTVSDHPPIIYPVSAMSAFLAATALGDLDTEDKRRSAMSPLTHVLMPLPDGTIVAVDRQQAAWMYSGIAAAAPVGGGQPYYIRDSYSMPDFLGNQQS